MSELFTIPVRTVNNIQRMMNRIRLMLEKQELNDLITADEAAKFMEVEIGRFRNMVSDGTIPANAIAELVNGRKKFYKSKLIKTD